jgi:hypothetical protein
MSADRTVLVLLERNRPIKTHAFNCSYVKAHERLHGPKYVEVRMTDVPANAGRCSHCGGGR